MENKPTNYFRLLVNYFLRGLLFVAPVFFTLYALYASLRWADDLIHDLFPQLFRGAGLLILIISITLVGLLTKLFFFDWVMNALEHLFNTSPVTKVIYSSLKDLFSAFVGDKKKMFSQPVMVMLFKEAGIQKLGFITKQDLEIIGVKGMAAVYFPHSYNFSGNLYLVPKENITVLHDFPAADAMKFIVSGGVTEIEKANGAKRTLNENT
jgi:uncharacterized membrane protein